jgi:hypothetical protein
MARCKIEKILEYWQDVTAGRARWHKLRGATSGQCEILGDIKGINRMNPGVEMEEKASKWQNGTGI